MTPNATYADAVVALRPMLVRVARQKLRNEAWAEDAVSEALVAALENPAAHAGRASLRTWLVGILKHKIVDQIRRHTRECQVDAYDAEPEFGALSDGLPGAPGEAHADWGDPQERLDRRQFMAELDRCLKTLPPQHGRAFVLRDWMDKETDDVCAELGVTANHLAVMLHRARRRLRESLQANWMPGGRAARLGPVA
jgi:RNA polymerase sigma-70 factor (TIGR02943 family)